MSSNTAFLREINARQVAFVPLYAKYTGSITAGLLLSQLMFYFSSLKKDKIFKTNAAIMDDTMLSENELRSAKKTIKKCEFLTIKKEGLPGRTFYEINWDKYYQIFSDFALQNDTNSHDNISESNTSSQGKITSPVALNQPHRSSEFHPTNKNNNFNTQTTTYTTTYNTRKNIKKENPQIEICEEKNSDEKLTSKKKFIKPTLEDLNSYKQEKDLNVDCESFYDYYEAKGWIIGRSPMKDWRATMRNWSRNQEAFSPPKQQIEKNYEDDYEWR